MNLHQYFKKFKDRELLLSKDECYTYDECYTFVKKAIAYFKSIGLKSNHKVLISAKNSILLGKIYLTFLANQTEVYIISDSLTENTVVDILKKNKFQFAIIDNKNCLIFKKKNLIKNIIELENLELNKIINNQNDENNLNFNLDINRTILNIFTSGTTNEPKKVSHSFYNLYNNSQEFSKIVKINYKSRFINFLPMDYLGGYYNLLLIPFFNGASVFIDEIFSIKTIINLNKKITEYGINTLWITPTICKLLLDRLKNIKERNALKKNIKLGLIGMDFIDPSLKENFFKIFKIKLLENYGLSETLFVSSERKIDKKSSSGVPLKSVKLKIDSLSNELVISSPFISKSFSSKNFKTGDKAEFKKRLFIKSRIKDIIIRGGMNINPNDIETILSKHKGIEEISIFGLKDENLQTEKIIAAIVKNKNFNNKKFWNYANLNLSANLVPNDILFLNNLPKTFSGKVKKNLIRNISINSVFIDIKNKKNTYKHNYSLPIEGIVPPISVSINDKVYELKKQKKRITTLSLGEAFFKIPYFDFQNLKYPDVYHYSHSRGIFELRTLLSNYFKAKYDIKFQPENQIMITAGSKIAVYMTLKSLINYGDEVLIPEPAWVSYSEQVKLVGGIPVGISYKEDVSNWGKLISKKTRLIIINNPNNPSGKIYNLNELSYIYDLAKKNNCYLLSDEAYSEFCYDQNDFISIGNLDINFERSILINSISKNYGISGWRIGYAISNKDVIERLVKVNQHLVTCAPTILSHYISKYFYEIIKETYPQIRKLLNLRRKIEKYMDKIELKYLKGSATFYFFINIEKSIYKSEKFCEKLLEFYGISTVPGIGYGGSCDGFIRLSIGAENENKIKMALDKIKILIAK